MKIELNDLRPLFMLFLSASLPWGNSNDLYPAEDFFPTIRLWKSYIFSLWFSKVWKKPLHIYACLLFSDRPIKSGFGHGKYKSLPIGFLDIAYYSNLIFLFIQKRICIRIVPVSILKRPIVCQNCKVSTQPPTFIMWYTQTLI